MKTSNNNQQTTGLQFFSDKNSNANIRMLIIDESPWFVGRDIALSLGYSNPVSAITQHVDNEDSAKYAIPDYQGFMKPRQLSMKAACTPLFSDPSCRRLKHSKDG